MINLARRILSKPMSSGPEDEDLKSKRAAPPASKLTQTPQGIKSRPGDTDHVRLYDIRYVWILLCCCALS